MDVDQKFLHFHEHLDIPDKRKMTSKSIYMFAESVILILYFRSGSRNSGGWLGIRIRVREDLFNIGILSTKLMGRRATKYLNSCKICTLGC